LTRRRGYWACRLRRTGGEEHLGGEWQELVDLLIASLSLTRAPVTADERNELRSLAKAMDLPADQLAELHVLG
jgi:hypothetical protein